MEYVPFGAQDKIRLSINIVRRLIAVPTSTGKLPTDDDCIKFQMMCQAKRLNPFEGDCFMIGYDTKAGPKFSQITAHQVFLKRSEASKEFNGMESGVVVKRGEEILQEEGDFTLDGDVLLGGWARVHKKGMEHPIFKRIKLSVFNKGQNQWLTNPSGMIVKCAEADALRTSFPSLLGSLYLREEIGESSEVVRISEPIFKSKEPEPPKETPPAPDLLGIVEAHCEKDGVDHKILIELLQASGLAGDGCMRLSDLSTEDMENVIKNWEPLMNNLKSTPGGLQCTVI